MSVPTANVLISQDKDSISKVLQKLGSGVPITNLAGQFSREDAVLLFSNHSNPNFISYTHNLMGNELESVLEFIDPKNEFEKNFISNRSVFASLKTYLSKTRVRGVRPKNSLDAKIQAAGKKSASNLQTPSAPEVQDIVSANTKKTFYITFGIGDNPKYWSKVQRVELTGIILDPSKSRKFTLKFTSTVRPLEALDRVGLFGEDVDLNTLGNSTSVIGYGQKFNFYDYFAGGAMAYGDSAQADNYPVDLHLMVVDTIRDYIRKASLGANVIICLPNLNKTCGERFDKIFSETKSGPYNVENLKSALRSFLSEIGMTLVSDDPTSRQRTPIEVVALEEKVQANAIERLEWHYSTFEYYPTLAARSPQGVPDFMGPLTECINKINKISQGNYTFTACYMDETDTEILDFWAGEDTHPFNGYEEFDPNAATVIIGDQTIVSNYLYGGGEAKDPIPLHYTDSLTIGKKGYKDKIRKLVGIYDSEYVFGDLYKAPDEFGFLDLDLFSPDQKKLIESESLPIFKYNTQNPNVLDLQAVDNGTYYANLNLSFVKNVERIASTVREGGVNVDEANFPIISNEGLLAAIYLSKFSQFGPSLTDKQIIDDVLSRIDPGLEKEIFGDLGNLVADRVGVIKGILDYLNNNVNNLAVEVDQEINTTPAILLDKFSDFLTRVVRQAKIKTLPFFNLSSRSLLNNSPCVLFAQDAPVLSQVQQNRTRFNNFLTGVYGIVGLKHTISKRDVCSEFSLVKADLTNSYKFKPAYTDIREDPSAPQGLPPQTPETFGKPLSPEAAQTLLTPAGRLSNPKIEDPRTLSPVGAPSPSFSPDSPVTEALGGPAGPTGSPLGAEAAAGILTPGASVGGTMITVPSTNATRKLEKGGQAITSTIYPADGIKPEVKSKRERGPLGATLGTIYEATVAGIKSIF